jgi:asparagine synthase (glutamine-hydrolysing)
MGFHEAAFSELPFARQVAQRYGTRHVEEMVTPDAVQLVDELAYYYDEPFADSSALPTYLVSKLARRSVKVVLSGDGGDEAFGGYARYAHDLREAAVRDKLPGWLRRGALGPLGRAWPKADWLPRPLRAKTLLTNLSLEGDGAYANTLTLCRQPLRRGLLATDLAASLNGHRPEELVRAAFATAPACDPLAGMLAADTAVLLPDDFLTKVDRASMAHGLEVRPPLVDHELMELAARVPSRFKVRGGETKWILKRTCADQLPHDAVWRAKQGFEIPVDAWLRGPLREMFEASVLAPGAKVAALVEPRVVGGLYRAHLAKVGRYGGILWAVLSLARWAERYM